MRAVISLLLVIGGCLSPAVYASPWEFEAPVAVTSATGERVFHHLDSAGRRNIAVAADQVAVAWEDNRDGTPRVYLARKPLATGVFSEAVRISGQGDAYEPSLVALDARRLVLAWEEDGRVHLRIADGERLGPIVAVSSDESVQPSLIAVDGRVLLVAAERERRFPRIVLREFSVADDLSLDQTASCPVDEAPPQDEQLYPAIAVQAGQAVVSWEDRRPGHTIIMAATSPVAKVCAFGAAERISWRDRKGGNASGTMRNMPYGKGHGVSRVALAAFGEDSVFAVWADKRNFREGYDIWGAPWTAANGFGENERVQDDFGGVAQQWHAAAAGHPDGTVVVAWDDERDGNPSIVLSWREQGGWSDDVVLPGASGPGEQAHPSIVLDADGNLHAAWVERDVTGGPTRLRYALGRVGR